MDQGPFPKCDHCGGEVLPSCHVRQPDALLCSNCGRTAILTELQDTLQRLVDLIQQVRNAQRSYFQTRRSDVLQQSKKLERQLDQLLEEITRTENQGRLF